MAIKIPKSGRASNGVVKSLEMFLGMRLPKGYRDFLKAHDGAEPEPNIFTIDDSNDLGVNRFIPAVETVAARKHLENVSRIALPIAWAACGNYVVLDMQADGVILYWDHETGDTTKIADGFDDFLSGLQPFNIDDIELNPDDVEEVWINPNPKKWIDPNEQ
jgi:hypothetical protein